MSVITRTEVRYTIECDNCHIKSHHSWEAPDDVADAFASVGARGWSTGLVDLCKTCVHTTLPHWRQHVDAIAAAISEHYRLGVRYRVSLCRRCNLWVIEPVIDDE